jgi:glyoxylase-like metal-dependent hydrolase (beta-lactamase superfamily II)
VLIDNAIAQGRFFGLDVEKPGKPDRYLTEEDRFDLGGHAVKIFHVPGHSPGSLAFFVENENKLFTGDVLFSGSIGRTDLPGGSYQTLIAGIRKKLLVLNDATEVFPGHGEPTTIGRERLLNPYLQ